MQSTRALIFSRIFVLALAWGPALCAQERPRAESDTRALELAHQTDQGPRESESERHWYGWETLLLDAVAASMMVYGYPLSRSADEPAEGEMLAAGVTLYATGAPVVHLAHGRSGWLALASLGIRVSSAALAFVSLLGAALDDEQTQGDIAAAGFLIGPAVLDAALFSNHTVVRKRQATGIGVSAAPVSGGFMTGVAGRF